MALQTNLRMIFLNPDMERMCGLSLIMYRNPDMERTCGLSLILYRNPDMERTCGLLDST